MKFLNLNPFLSLSPKTGKIVLWIFALSTLLLFIAISILDSPLKTVQAPSGIVSLELAGTFNKTKAILSSWNHQARLSAIQSLVVDYLFLISYSFFFAFLIWKVSAVYKNKNDSFFKIGIILGWLQFAAAIFDSFENYFLLRLVFGSQNQNFSTLAFYFASTKFLLILLGIVYIIFSLFFHFIVSRARLK